MNNFTATKAVADKLVVDKFSRYWVNLASAKLGATALACSDDFFAAMGRMLQDHPAVFIADKYDDNGKWMDGWESRRKRGAGHDWCIVKLARPGVIHGIEIDTTHFTGNHAPMASIEACSSENTPLNEATNWEELVPQCLLDGDSQHQYSVTESGIYTHIRLNIYPDGGIARLRVYARPQINWSKIPHDEPIDLAAALNGGVALACSDEHFGNINNLLAPGRGKNMGDGWETRRRRGTGHDWVVIALARAGTVKRINVDTSFFKGNYPDQCSIQGGCLEHLDVDSIASDSQKWQYLLPPVKLAADTEHGFVDQIINTKPVTHIRLNIYPDGGVSRFRVLATISES